jgi:hypothetical protein
VFFDYRERNLSLVFGFGVFARWTPCKNPKTKKQCSFHGASLKIKKSVIAGSAARCSDFTRPCHTTDFYEGLQIFFP